MQYVDTDTVHNRVQKCQMPTSSLIAQPFKFGVLITSLQVLVVEKHIHQDVSETGRKGRHVAYIQGWHLNIEVVQ